MIKFEFYRNDISIELYSRDNKVSKLELMKESIKTLQREVIKYESDSNSGLIRPASSDFL